VLLGAWLITELRGRSAGEGTIVFAADRSPAYYGDIYRVTFDGKRTNLTHSNYAETDPLLSPDGKWVAFESKKPGYSAVFVVRVDGKGLTQISPKVEADAGWYNMSWSPDSERLAIGESNDRTAKLFVLGAHRDPHVIASTSSDYGAGPPVPTWSPTGRAIAFDEDWGESETVRVVTPEGRAIFSVDSASTSSYSLTPSWSVNGRLLVQRDARISVYSERGRLLADYPGSASGWSPDGKLLASVIGGRLEVRDGSAGRVLLKKRVYSQTVVLTNKKEGDYFPELLWLGNGRVGITGVGAGFAQEYGGQDVAVDVRTGRIETIGERLWDAWYSCGFYSSCARADHSQVAETARYRGGGYYLRIARLGSANVRTVRKLVRVPGCWDDTGVMEAAVSSVQLSTKSKSIVYQSYCVQPYSDLYLISPDGSNLRRLTRARTFLGEPQWSPDGRKIALSRTDGVGRPGEGCPTMVWTMDANGNGLQRLTPKSDVMDCSADSGPNWTPGGRSIVYSHSVWEDGESELRIIPASGGKPRALHVRSPYWYLGPKRIAYLDNDDNVWTANPDGSDRRRMASKAHRDSTVSSLVWSPDGGRLAWLESKEDGAFTIVVLGNALERFPASLRFASDLTWSPDGRTLAFTASAPEQHFADVYTIGADGKHLTRLTDGMNASGVSWR
jgi:Tol biopolymer transport system component